MTRILDEEELEEYFVEVIKDVVDSGYDINTVLNAANNVIIAFPANNPIAVMEVKPIKKIAISQKKQLEILTLIESRNFKVVTNTWGHYIINCKKILPKFINELKGNI